MILGDAIMLGGSGGQSASIFVTGLTSADTVVATKGSKTRNGVWTTRTITTTTFKYLKWSITKIKSASTYMQLSEFKVIDANNNAISWADATITGSKEASSTTEGADKIIDGSVETKYCCKWASSSTQTGTCDIIIQLDSGIDISVYNRYQYYTANDCVERDPISWTLSVSNDGTNWHQVDTQSDVSITSTRKSLAGTWEVDEYEETTTVYGHLISNIDEYGTWTVTSGSKSMTQEIDMATEYTLELDTKLYLYNLGDECEDVTGGWVSTALKKCSNTSNVLTAPTMSKGTDGITGTVTKNGSNGNGGTIVTTNMIDVTNYSSLTFVVSNVTTGAYNRLGVGAYSSNDTLFEQETYVQLFIQSAGTYTVDITSLTGNNYVAVYFYNAASASTCTGKIDKVWLE